MRARSREWNGFRMTSTVGSVVLCALGHVYPITRAFICTRRRFRFARSIPHTRPDVIRIRIVSSSALRIHGYGRRHNWSTARQYPGAKQMRKVRCFLSPSTESCDGRRPSYRSQPFQTSIGQESSTLFYARLTLVSSLQTDPS